MVILLRAEVESGSDQFIAFRVINLELFPRPDRAVVPIVDAVAIEVRLADLRPVFAWVGTSVGVFPKTFIDYAAINRVLALAPGRVNGAQRRIDGVAELVQTDAFVVVTVQREAEQIFFAEAGGLAAGATDALVLVNRVWVVPVFGHIG